MNLSKLFVITGALALCAPAVSQAAYVTAPAGYLTKSGGYYTNWPFVLINGHAQIGDPTMKANGSSVLREVAYRSGDYLNDFATVPARGPGRTYTQLTLSLGDTDCAKMTTTYSTNVIGALTEVFKGKFTLPSITQNFTSHTWGNMGNVVFQKLHIYSGKNDLLQDWDYMGGTLANGSTAGAAAYSSDGGFSYTGLVKYIYAGSPYAPGSKYLPRSPFARAGKNCVDSSQTQTGSDAYAYAYAVVYADTYTVTSLQGKAYISSANIYYMAKTAKFIGAMTVGGSDAGVKIPGWRCQPLHVNMGFPLAVFFGTTNASGYALNLLPTGTANAFTYPSGVAGVPLVFQGAWENTANNQPSLTVAGKYVLPAKPDGKPTYDINCSVYHYFTGTTRSPASGAFVQNSGFVNAIDRYRTK